MTKNHNLIALQTRLKMDSSDPDECGLAGETLAAVALQCSGVIWLKIDQNPFMYSKKLLHSGGKRPDFLVIFDDKENMFIDVKTYTPIEKTESSITFRIKEDEHKKFENTQKITGIDVTILFLNKKSVYFEGGFAQIKDFGDSYAESGVEWRNISIVKSDMFVIKKEDFNVFVWE